MKITILIGACTLAWCINAHSQGLTIRPGTNFKAGGNVSLVVQNGSLANNGTGSLAGANVYLTGNVNDSIYGSGSTDVASLYIDKGAGTGFIGKNMAVTNNVVMVSGLLDLNKHTLTLSPTGSVVGETEATRIIGPSGGYISITVDLNEPLGDNPGNLGALFASTQNFGSVNIQRSHDIQKNSGSGKSIARSFTITPANNANLNAILRFKYFVAELNGLTESTLKMWKSTDNGVTYTNIGADGNNTAQHFVDVSDLNSFGKQTLSSSTFSLTGKIGGLDAKPNEQVVIVTWTATRNINADGFTVERSDDSTNWYAIGKVDAIKDGTAFNAGYTFNDVNVPSNKVYYRVQSISSDPVVTNIAAVQPQAKMEATLTPNPVLNTGKVTINVRNANNAVLTVLTVDGRQVLLQPAYLSKGVNQVNINVATMAKGMYYLVIQMADGTKKTIPFVKQ